MKKILFPTDFSETAANALKYALELAEEVAAKVDVINVFHLPITAVSDIPAEMIPKLWDEQKAEVQEQLNEFVSPFSSEALGTTEAVLGMFVVQEIIDYATDNNYELLVLGTKGNRNALDKILGTTTTQTMMQAPCPVLAIPREARFKGIEKITYATDFDPSDSLAIGQLILFAGTLNAKMNFVHVTDKGEASSSIEDLMIVENHPFEFTEFSIVKGASVMSGLDQYIKEKGTDLLALFIPRRRLWERLFHTSVSKRMIFHTNTPLLVFHE